MYGQYSLCFIVSINHIDALTTFAIDAQRKCRIIFTIDPEREPDEFGRTLWNANVSAYNDWHRDNFEGQYRYQEFHRILSPVEALKACDCYKYQCSKWGGWNTSKAKKLIEEIQGVAIRMLPGYEDAQWEIAF